MLRYWRALLVLCAMIGMLSLCFAAWTIIMPFRLPPPQAPVGQDGAETLSREQLQTVLDLFEQKRLRHEKAKAEHPSIGDPSS